MSWISGLHKRHALRVELDHEAHGWECAKGGVHHGKAVRCEDRQRVNQRIERSRTVSQHLPR
jgi:hypothetical protein